MTRPAFAAPEWATDATYPADAGPDASGDTKIPAPSAYRHMGFRRDNPALAQYLNDLHNRQGAWLAYWADQFIDQGADITLVDGAFEGALFFVPASGVPGWYYWTATPVGTEDGAWLINSPTGQWVSILFNSVTFGKVASVGVVPGIAGSTSGKIQKSVVPFGYVSHITAGPATYSTASTTEDILEDLNVGTLAVGDFVEMHCSAVSQCSAIHSVGMYVTQNAGSPIYVTPSAGALPTGLYPATSGAADIAVALSWAHRVTVAGPLRAKLSGYTSNASFQLNVTLSEWILKVYRP